jgi:formylglycine-generating enzyme required for sulfatase activity
VSRALRIVVVVLAAACTTPAEEGPRGARFVPRGEAILQDAGARLEWTRRDDGVGRDWHAAEAYCRVLTLGGSGWRLPTIEELRTLRAASARTPCGDVTCGIDPAFGLSNPYVWTSTAQGDTARTYLDFQFGTELTPSIGPRLLRRVLCVRAAGL